MGKELLCTDNFKTNKHIRSFRISFNSLWWIGLVHLTAYSTFLKNNNTEDLKMGYIIWSNSNGVSASAMDVTNWNDDLK